MQPPCRTTRHDASESSSNTCPDVYHVVDGVHLSRLFTERSIRSAMSYGPRDDDVFVVSYPKCGSTWLQQIVNVVLKSDDDSTGKSAGAGAQELPAFLDLVGAAGALSTPRPGCLKTHLPYGKHPVFVGSQVHLHNPEPLRLLRELPTYRFQEGTFDQFFNMFVEGKVDYGDYFDHLLSWYAHRGDPNVLFITYEQLKRDTAGCVLKTADFLGKDKYGEKFRKNPKLLGQVLAQTSVENMKSLNSKMKNWTGLIESVPADAREELRKELKGIFGDIWDVPGNAGFIRKGLVGLP
ncbi:hypothetical protein MRX96_007953 [Rhipicephalus microplus]